MCRGYFCINCRSTISPPPPPPYHNLSGMQYIPHHIWHRRGESSGATRCTPKAGGSSCIFSSLAMSGLCEKVSRILLHTIAWARLTVWDASARNMIKRWHWLARASSEMVQPRDQTLQWTSPLRCNNIIAIPCMWVGGWGLDLARLPIKP